MNRKLIVVRKVNNIYSITKKNLELKLNNVLSII